jgi:hypothetical protein
VFGEELIIENAEEALRKTCEAWNTAILEYTVAPIFMSEGKKGAHEWLIEFRNPPVDLDAFGADLDTALQSINSDYEAKRYKNITLNPLRIHLAKAGLFYDWLKAKGKLGGQHKVPRLSNSREYLEELLALNN